MGGCMARLRSALVLAGAMSLPLALGGCAGALVVGGLAAAGGAGYAAGQERGLNVAASDFAVKTDIEKALIATDPRLQTGVTTSVYEGRVLLTGRLPSEQL